jgi:choline dehydrogenase
MYDTIIVGAGSAGCVLANRLSAESNRNILLLEAGNDYVDLASTPEEIAISRSGPVFPFDWGLTSEAGLAGQEIPLQRPKVIGGSSSTNATVAPRGHPTDYDEWAKLGNEGWSYEDVLPYFRKLEKDCDFGESDGHGGTGFLPIKRDSFEDLSPPAKAFLKAAEACGHALIDDLNGGGGPGVTRWPKNTVHGIRMSCALTYLAAARHRSNLTVRGNSLVDCVLFDREKARGVRLAGSGEEIAAQQVILSAGAYLSPTLLMRSGIGPADHLSDINIDCRVDARGVGNNLADHCACWIRFRATIPPEPSFTPTLQVLATVSSGEYHYAYDLHVFPRSIQLDEEGQPEFRITTALMKPHSRGTVRLRSADAGALPAIDIGYFSHPDDMPRLIHGVRRAREIAAKSPLADLILEEIYPGSGKTAEADLHQAIRVGTKTYHHPVGTCSMGAPHSKEAVVSNRGKVHGVEGLYVIDASIMPTVPAANTNVPTIMVAERCADWLLEEL